MVAAANSIKDTGSPLEVAKVLRAVRHQPDYLSYLLSLPTNSELVRRTLSLINLEDGPFKMVVNGEVRLDDAIVVGRLVDHGSSEGQRQFELRALSAKTRPGDESNAALIRQKLIEVRARAASQGVVDHASHDTQLQCDLLALLTEIKPEDEAKAEALLRGAFKIHAELMGEELKCQNSERIFQQSYWCVGNVLSWIAIRDVKLLCQILDYTDWRRAVTYGDNGPTWKVADPSGELIGALQDGRLRSSRQKNRESPEDLRANFWARKSISDLFAIDPDFERSEVLGLWPAGSGPKQRPGAKESWDWEALGRKQEEHLKSNGGFRSSTEHKKWCTDNLILKSKAKSAKGKYWGDPPDPHTVANGIRRHKLDEMTGIFCSRLVRGN